MKSRWTRSLSAAAASTLGLGTLLTVGVSSASADAVTCPIPATDPNLINVLNVNDFHGRIDANTVAVAATVEQLRAEAGDDVSDPDAPGKSLFLSAGDNIGASLFASAVQDDQPTMDVLAALDLATSAVGNHEFDKGADDLLNRVVPDAGFPYLAANVYTEGTQTPILPEYQLVEVNGLQVAVIGVVTQETPALTGGTEGYVFGDPVAAVNRIAAQLSDSDTANGEADVIIAEYHEGAPASDDAQTLEQQVANSAVFNSIVNNTSAAVDAIFTGHTHQQYAYNAPIPGESGTRPIVQTGSYGENIGQIMLSVDPTTHAITSYCARNVPRLEEVTDEQAAWPRVSEVAQITEAALAYAAEVGNDPIGAVTSDVTTAFKGGSYSGTGGTYVGGERDDRSGESSLGNLVADAMVATLSDPERGGATIGVVNPGGLRAELFYAGDTSSNPENTDGVITYAEANSVLPFVNNLWSVTVTGAQFKAILEEQWQTTLDGTTPSRPFLKLGLSDNVTYTYDPDAAQGSHITSITIDGQPYDPNAEYRVGTFSFLAQGNDNFHTFAQSTDVQDSGLIDRDAWIQYLTDNSPVSPSFAKGAVAVDQLPTTVNAGSALDFNAYGFDLTSLGSPQNTGGTVLLNGAQIGTFTVEGIPTAPAEGEIVAQAAPAGEPYAHITTTIPPGTSPGAATLQLVFTESGTTVTIPIAIAATASITVDQTWVPGETATASISGFPAGASVPLTLSDGTVVATIVTDANGVGSATFAVPNLAVGSYTLTAAAGQTTASAVVTVVGSSTSPAPPSTTPPTGGGSKGGGPLAKTGADVKAPLATAVVLLIAGAGCLVAGRRRTT